MQTWETRGMATGPDFPARIKKDCTVVAACHVGVIVGYIKEFEPTWKPVGSARDAVVAGKSMQD